MRNKDMEDLKKKMSADMNDKEIVFSKSIKAGKTILVPGSIQPSAAA